MKRFSQCCSNQTVFHCNGCRTSFCFSHGDEHRRSLNEQLDWLSVEHDDFITKLNRKTIEIEKNDSYCSIIDRWEKDSIEQIRRTADEARRNLNEAKVRHVEQIKEKVSLLTKKLDDIYRHEQKFDEKTLELDARKLKNLKHDLEHFSSFSVRIFGNKPVVMPIIRLKNEENLLDEEKSRPIGFFPVAQTEIFVRPSGNIEIRENGALLVHDNSKIYGSARISNEFSFGRNRIRFQIESLTRNAWIFFGIVTKNGNVDGKEFLQSSAHGWSAPRSIYRSGIFLPPENRTSFEKNQIFELKLDAELRTISLHNAQNDETEQIQVDLKTCPFPWKIVVSLKNPDDSVRILSSNVSNDEDYFASIL